LKQITKPAIRATIPPPTTQPATVPTALPGTASANATVRDHVKQAEATVRASRKSVLWTVPRIVIAPVGAVVESWR